MVLTLFRLRGHSDPLRDKKDFILCEFVIFKWYFSWCPENWHHFYIPILNKIYYHDFIRVVILYLRDSIKQEICFSPFWGFSSIKIFLLRAFLMSLILLRIVMSCYLLFQSLISSLVIFNFVFLFFIFYFLYLTRSNSLWRGLKMFIKIFNVKSIFFVNL